MLALTGDKRFLLAETDDAMLMYQVRGASLDRDGRSGRRARLARAAVADPRHGGHRAGAVAALPDHAPRARPRDRHGAARRQIWRGGDDVDLADLDYETPRLRSVRRSERAAAKRGLAFRIVPAAEVPAIMDGLAAISDQWRAAKGQAEKSFSLGRFDPDYLRHFDVAVAMVEGRIVAFANLPANRRPAGGVDRPDAPCRRRPARQHGLPLLPHPRLAKDQGYARFSLGIAPLSGIDGRRLAPAWARAAALVFRHGERLYGFRGLRAFEEVRRGGSRATSPDRAGSARSRACATCRSWSGTLPPAGRSMTKP
ncbi:phosphatidylglycerol lysyltransferase domain-containing protein [Sphingomonas sp. MMS24-JH45]